MATNTTKNTLFNNHMQRLRAGADRAVALKETSKWIAQNTSINGRAYSYKNHEYQQRILDSEAIEINVRKCSQVGITELAVRRALALCGMIKNFTVIYTLPTATFAATLSKTRVDPIINESPFLHEMMGETDNVEVKRIGSSLLYMKGAASGNAPISIPADAIFSDEINFSDPHVLSQYQSRLTHSEYKMKFKLSTPTIPGKGIDYEFSNSRRHFLFAKCSHCGHSFIPDYYENVRIPDFSGDLREVTKRNLHKYRYSEAKLHCPKCDKVPDLSPDFREWVCENPGDAHVAEGFQVSPFDAPNLITPGYLVEASTNYTDVADFVNFNLGLPYFSQESVLSPTEIQACITTANFGMITHVMGIDLGKTCHIVVAGVHWDGSMQVVRLEEVPLQNLKQRYKELRLQYRVRVAVIDSLPYTDMVLSLQAEDPNLWASVYTQFRGVELFTVKHREETPDAGLQQLRQINVARDRTFDALMAFMRSGQFSKVSCEHDATFVTHCTDMRRVKDFSTKTQQMEFRWIKSELGDDHFWFATSYAFLAKHIVGTATGSQIVLPFVSSFNVEPRKIHQNIVLP